MARASMYINTNITDKLLFSLLEFAVIKINTDAIVCIAAFLIKTSRITQSELSPQSPRRLPDVLKPPKDACERCRGRKT